MGTNKKYLTIGVIMVVVILVIGVLSLLSSNKSRTPSSVNKPTESMIPTVDNSVVVDLSSISSGKEVKLAIKGIPQGTTAIDYELSYQTAKQGLQGVIGTISLTGESDYEKKLTLGTCSSGTCVYHQVVGKIGLTLKFSGNYGEKMYQKEYEI